MNGPSEFDDEEFRTAPSTREHSLSVNRSPIVTQLPGVFVPSCHNGTVIYPTTTQRDPNLARRPSIVPPGPPTTLDCSLLSNGDVETMMWAPQASPVFRRPSRCMSMDQTRTQTHSHCLPPFAGEAVAKGNLSGNECLAGESQNSSSRTTNHRSRPVSTSKLQHGPTTMPIRGRRDIPGSHSSINARHGRHSSRSEHLSDTPRRSGPNIWGKPNTLMQQIMGKSTRAADTATTINEPETSFFNRSAINGQVRSRSVSRPAPITTIVSRDSITDIRWLANTLAEQSGQARGPASDAPEVPTSAVCQTNSSKFTVLATLEHEDKDKFNMYHLGIDARLGSVAASSKDSPHRDSEHPTSHEVDLPLDDPASVKTKPSHRGSEGLSDSHACSENKASGQLAKNPRRRSAHFAEPLVQDTRKAEPGFMQQITRKISSVFQSSPSSSRTTRAPAPSEVENEVTGKAAGELGASRLAAGTGGPGVDCLSEPEPDAVYQAMVLSKPTKDKKQRRSTCSEDYIPHACVDDLSTSGMPSPNIQ
ncbi:hypothetical protein JMJ77_0009775 [Colletotrichum scovillei]|uniref:Uncharacterized protein n=1 Tax=Colletotrichum scovillei TaxID=1209932 RepID=A0A9P7R0J4_9PEZI|nr:hypothetical protein JMJ77_0009775 [Colletotrichum scovillei]KAG7052861.1 hypothetical protein JMJ78_0005872 [Colletotrichum scovillei]KAG7065150.1 hypothetical protein JMJ76_0012902 [Colletotrichum scovillei]